MASDKKIPRLAYILTHSLEGVDEWRIVDDILICSSFYNAFFRRDIDENPVAVIWQTM